MKRSVRYLVLFFLIYFFILIPFIQFVRIGQGIQEISFTLQTLHEEIEKVEVRLKDIETRLNKTLN